MCYHNIRYHCLHTLCEEGSALMAIEEQKYNRAFSILIESLDELNSNDIHIGELEREIKRWEKKKDLRTTLIAAVNFFTKEKITELHTASVELLKCDDFDVEEYISRFSDISTVNLGDIDFLLQRQREINSFEINLNSSNQSQRERTKLSRLADTFLKGGANND